MPSETTGVFDSLGAFIKRIESLSHDDVETRTAVDYLPSHLFSRDALTRFCTAELGDDGLLAARRLWDRARAVRSAAKHAPYRDLIEISALERICTTGQVHEALPSFRATAHETAAALAEALARSRRNENYAIAFCKERLPFVFTISGIHSLIIDVQHNRGYQRIQGLEVADPETVRHFSEEFDRIWIAPGTVHEPQAVRGLLEERIAGL